MGSLFALVAIAASIALVLLPQGTAGIFVALGVSLAALLLAAWLRTRAGLMAGATVLTSFSILIAHPFAITRQQLNALNRAARQGDETAQAMVDFFAALEPFATGLMVLIALAVIGIFVVSVRRAYEGGHPFMLRESDALATFVSRTGMAAAMLYVPMIVIIIYDVLQRKYLDINPAFTRTEWYRIFTSTRLQEMEWHLHAVLFLMCLAFAYVRDAHVRIELVRERMGPRTRVWIELFGCLFFLVPYCYVVVLYGTEFAQRSFSIMERSSAQTGLELRFIIKGFLPLGFTLLALAGASVALKCIVYLFGPPHMREASGYYAGIHHPGIVDVAPPAETKA
jgi:TRAP-type mannitol/chloroaromatic compound transport system permease small subunit